MKKVIVIGFLLLFLDGFTQVCIGCKNSRVSVGASVQKNGVGGNLVFDYGISNFFSFGISTGYVVVAKDPLEAKGITEPVVVDKNDLLAEKADFSLRFISHLGSAFRYNETVDIYAGVNGGFRNVGGLVGVVFSVNPAFGFYAEGNIPLYKHNAFLKNTDPNYYDFYNQPVLNIGVVFSN